MSSRKANEDSDPTPSQSEPYLSGGGETYQPQSSDTDGRGLPRGASGEGSKELALPPEFQLVRSLGRGGMGVVYLVKRDTGFGEEELALKTILPEHLGNQAAIERFVKEVETLKGLRHDHIVPLRDFRKYQGYFYFLMEYIAGSTLDIYLRDRSPLSVSEALKWFTPLAEAVDYAHRKGVVHRDIKPSNVMLGSNGSPYLLDFGIARQADSAHTQARRLGAGTWEYMAPEQFDDDRPTRAMDVYSFGATLYFALVGRAPFSAVGIRSLLKEKEAGCPTLEIAGLERHAVEALRSSMDVDATNRPDSCGELVKRLLEKPATASVELPAAVRVIEVAPAVPAASIPPQVKLEEPFTNSIGMKFRMIDPRTFLMGSPNSESSRGDNEIQHQVTLTLTRPYYLGVYAVTQEEYKHVMGSNPSHFSGNRHPVENVSWEDAMAFLTKLNALSAELLLGIKYRLPTEAEWEYACRVGTTTAYSFGDSESDLEKYGWYDKNSRYTTHPVGEKLPNGWGLYDMHGNVWEWCADWYGAYPITAVTDPTGPTEGSLRVLRGGCWFNGTADCRSARRGRDKPSIRNCYYGFRVVMSPFGIPGRRRWKDLRSGLGRS